MISFFKSKIHFISLFTFSILLLSCKNADTTSSLDTPHLMPYVEVEDALGNNRKFSKLIMGTDHLAQAGWQSITQQQMSDEEIFKVLDEAARLGINFFDSSPIYAGFVESKLGKWISSRRDTVKFDTYYLNSNLNPDRRLYALTKGGFPFDLYYSKTLNKSTASIELIQKLESEKILLDTTLSRLTNVPLGTYQSRLYGNVSDIVENISIELGHALGNLDSNITVYLMHRDDYDFLGFKKITRDQTPVDSILKALSADEIKNNCNYFGLSNWTTERVNSAVEIGQQNSYIQPTFNSPYFSLFEMGSSSIHAGGIQVTHDEMMDSSFQPGVKLMPYSPLGGFSILDKPEPKWENAKKAAKELAQNGDSYYQKVYSAIFTNENEERYKRIVDFTQAFNKQNNSNFTVDQMLNAYVLAHPRTDFLAIGPLTIEQLNRTVGALKLAQHLKPADLEYLYRGK